MATSDDDEAPPSLSAATLEALKEFLAEQNLQEKSDEPENSVELVSEDWRLSQFWYEPETARTIAEEILWLRSYSDSPCLVACVSCPTIYAYLKKMDPDISAHLLEFDRRFEQYGSDFIFYDYNQPIDLPSSMHNSYQIIISDPPYLSEECLEKVAETVSFLAQSEDSLLLLLTGKVQEERAFEFLKVRVCGFRPEHSSKLGNEFRLFTSYDPQGRLGGWV